MTAMPFYGRERELAALAGELQRVRESGSGRLIAVRGRRPHGAEPGVRADLVLTADDLLAAWRSV